ECDLDIFHALVSNFLLDRSQPGDMRVKAIDRQSEQFAIALGEILLHGSKGHKLRCANGCKIRRVRKKHNPASLEIFREMNFALRRLSGKFGRPVSNQWHSANFFSHFNFSRTPVGLSDGKWGLLASRQKLKCRSFQARKLTVSMRNYRRWRL